MRRLLILFFCIKSLNGTAQNYFPPVNGNDWQTINPESLGWCQDKIDTLLNYLEAKNSKSFIIAVNGKLVLEEYFGTYTSDSVWYWASAGKTLTAALIGAAQDEGLLSINDPSSLYLGEAWTSCSQSEEMERTIRHQLTMTSTFNVSGDLNCTDPACLQCIGPAGSQWYYHNAPYLKLFQVITAATGQTMNSYTNQKIESVTGMNGFWFGNLYVSTARDMARFGLLAANGFNWNGTPVIEDEEYIQAMVTASQNLNPSYGYLWWLNGAETHIRPGFNFSFQGPLIPQAPADLYAALGANDQKIYVVPSLNMVVVRQGNAAFETALALSTFDNELWELITTLPCVLDIEDQKADALPIFEIAPNPQKGKISINGIPGSSIAIHDLNGRLIKAFDLDSDFTEIAMPTGLYLIHSIYQDRTSSLKALVY